ncbi:hypothetical protein RBB77_21290 [Tunturibacter psychrotolerans]|uniref:Uncharacterized protein n=1 Tax=Tunturiibacter psychrotolerans TaxID=3069686 RepID=A0AAU7ZPS4_9BACT
MRRAFVVLITFFCLGTASLLGQGLNLTVGIPGNVPAGTIEEMDNALIVATPEQKVDLLKRFGVEGEIARGTTTAWVTRGITLEPLRGDANKNYGLLALPCETAHDYAFLYLLEDTGKNNWRAVDHTMLECFGGQVSHKMINLLPGTDLILVEHATTGHGSGLLEESTQIFRVRAGKLHRLMSTPDYVKDWTDIFIERNSSFVVFPGGRLEETRLTSVKERPTRVERRMWTFSPDGEALAPTPFHSVRE